jgi:hypothetical protein
MALSLQEIKTCELAESTPRLVGTSQPLTLREPLGLPGGAVPTCTALGK